MNQSFRDIGILFSAPMIRALLERRKNNTRRMAEQWMKVKAGDRLWVRQSYQLETLLEDIPAGMMTNSKDPVRYCADGFVRGEPIDDFGRTRPSIHMPRWASRITLEATEDARREPLRDISEADSIAEGISPLFTRDDIYNGGDPPHYRAEFDLKPMPWTNYLWHGLVGKSITQKQSDAHQHQYSSYVDPRDSFFSLWDSLHAKDAPVSSNPVPVRLAFKMVRP